MDFFSEIFSGHNLMGLLTLVILEVILGVDNIIFMAIQLDKLPPEKRDKARYIGLAGAAVLRILFLLSIKWLMDLQNDLFSIFDNGISAKDLVMIGGGLYLLYHSVKEVHLKVNGHSAEVPDIQIKGASFLGIIISILLLDIVFSIDSVLTAVGMVESIPVMILAIVISIIVMLLYSGAVIRFVNTHPAVQILALTFLVLIGVLLIAEGFGQHVSKGYVYSAVAFAVFVEFLQIRAEKTSKKSS